MCKAWDDMIEEGIRNAEKEMIQKALKKGCSLEMISDVMDLSLEEIDTILNSIE